MRGAGAVRAAAERRGGDRRGGDEQSGGETRCLPPALPPALTRSLPGCGCCNRGSGGGSSGNSLEAGVEVRRGWTEAAGRSGRTDGEGCMGMWAPGRLADGAGRATPMGRGSVGHTTGARESLGEGLRGPPGRGGSTNAPNAQQENRTRWRPGRRRGCGGSGMGVRGLGQSACQSGRVSAQLGFEVLEHLLGSDRLEQEETTARVLFTKGLIFPGLSRAGD